MKYIFGSFSATCCLAVLCFTFSCHKPDSVKAAFDSKAMLTNVGNNIIVPNYLALQSSSASLDSAVAAFNQSPNSASLLTLQTNFKNAYRAWQACSVFEFGPAEQQEMRVHLNTFPTDTGQINSNLTSGSYNLDAIANLDAQGFPGIDYLLFGVGTDNNTILAMYTTDGKASARKAYLAALSADIKTRTNTVSHLWSSGNYAGTFASALGTDIGGSTGLLVNQLDYDFEILKNNKLGIPLGKQSMGAILPQKVEAYYSGISAELALLQLRAFQSIYLGTGTQGDGVGLDDCLIQLNAKYGSGTLSDTIRNQFTVAITKLQAVQDPLSAGVINNPAPASDAYLELQKLLVLLKTDMPSAMTISITYADTDGD